jgi:hypothetical protein
VLVAGIHTVWSMLKMSGTKRSAPVEIR